jgi:GxxExxY protein
VHLDCGYKIDLVVEQEMIVELKAIEKILPVREAQLFNVSVGKDFRMRTK